MPIRPRPPLLPAAVLALACCALCAEARADPAPGPGAVAAPAAASPASAASGAPAARGASAPHFGTLEQTLSAASHADPREVKKLTPRPAKVCMRNRKVADEAVVACMTGEGPVPQ